MKNKKIKNFILLYILIPLILTALWEKILNQFLDYSIEKILSAGGIIFDKISLIIYTRISSGYLINFSNFVLENLLSIGIVFLIFETYDTYKSYIDVDKVQSEPSFNDTCELSFTELSNKLQENQNKIKFLYKKYFKLKIGTITCLIIFYLITVAYTSYVDNTIIKLTSNIEIVSPYINDIEYKTLKSQFYSMKSGEDFIKLNYSLERIASKNHIVLK